MGVHFPALNRKPFASDAQPTDAEAKDALRGYVGYFGALGVYPGQVFHQILGGTVSAGSIRSNGSSTLLRVATW